MTADANLGEVTVVRLKILMGVAVRRVGPCTDASNTTTDLMQSTQPMLIRYRCCCYHLKNTCLSLICKTYFSFNASLY